MRRGYAHVIVKKLPIFEHVQGAVGDHLKNVPLMHCTGSSEPRFLLGFACLTQWHPEAAGPMPQGAGESKYTGCAMALGRARTTGTR